MQIEFPENLPVSARRQDIALAIQEHPVIIVCGETGSGKTTQLPKIGLTVGRGAKGKTIAHTQPRRLAAVTVADLTLRRGLGDGRTLFLTVENLTDARVEAGRGADGVVTLASPRLFLAGLRAAW